MTDSELITEIVKFDIPSLPRENPCARASFFLHMLESMGDDDSHEGRAAKFALEVIEASCGKA